MKDWAKQRFPGLFRALKRTYYRMRRLNPFISSRYVYVGHGKYLDLKRRHIKELKPNLFIIGAEKSGTTSLHNYLDQHPDIFMSKPNKEPHFALPLDATKKYFARDHMPVASKDDVLRIHMLRGYKGQRYIGESTAAYTRGRLAQKFDTPARIKRISPDARIIYIIRNPFERLVSSHQHRKREGWTIFSDLNDDITQNPQLVETSRYAAQLKPYESDFPGRVLVLRLKDLNDSKNLSSIIATFLNIPQHSLPKVPKFNRNPKNATHKFNPDLFNTLKETFLPEIKQVEGQYGVDLSHWDLSKKRWVKDGRQ